MNDSFRFFSKGICSSSSFCRTHFNLLAILLLHSYSTRGPNQLSSFPLIASLKTQATILDTELSLHFRVEIIDMLARFESSFVHILPVHGGISV